MDGPPIPRLLTLLALASSGAFAVACADGPEGGAEQKGPEVAVVSELDVVQVEEGSVSSGPRISGTLEALDQAVIRAETGGSVLKIGPDVGARVEKGTFLARIESDVAEQSARSARTAVSAADTDLAVARRELDRSRRLVESGAVPATQVEQAESAVAAAEARLADARSRVATAADQVEATEVRAPIDGVVSARGINVGDVVEPGAAMYTVIDPSRLRLEGAVPADAVGLLEVGRNVDFAVQGHPGKRFAGTIESVSPAVDPLTRQIPVVVTLPNPEGVLVAGLFAEGRVAAEQRDGLIVPTDAVEESGGKASVLRIRDGVVERVEVTLGLRDEDAERIELTSGVNAGDVVLVGAARDVKPGTSVEIRSEPKG